MVHRKYNKHTNNNFVQEPYPIMKLFYWFKDWTKRPQGPYPFVHPNYCPGLQIYRPSFNLLDSLLQEVSDKIVVTRLHVSLFKFLPDCLTERDCSRVQQQEVVKRTSDLLVLPGCLVGVGVEVGGEEVQGLGELTGVIMGDRTVKG